ncbi:MAG: YetF domain-containing protein [Pseudomonadota bacterium]
MFDFTIPPLQLVLRGSLMFWFLFVLFRFVLRRDIGSVGVSDFLFVVILGDAAQNAMIGDGTSVADGMWLIATLAPWNYVMDWATWRFPAVERLANGTRKCLARNGRLLRKTMRREYITEDELMAKLHQAGLEELGQAKAIYLEPDGEIAVIKHQA